MKAHTHTLRDTGMKGSEWWDQEVPEALGDAYTLAVLEAVRAGHAVFAWQTIVEGDLEFEILRAPLAIGSLEDHVFLFGLSAEAVDMIALGLAKLDVHVMSPTPYLYDLAAEHPDQRQIGPHTLPTLLGVPNGAAGMTKTAAKAHADALARDMPGRCSFVSAACKTYVLQAYGGTKHGIRPRYACEYGYRLPGKVGWGSANASCTGWVIQPAQWAHLYREFWDYIMGAVYVHAHARLRGLPIDLRETVQEGAEGTEHSVPFVIHPECREPLTVAQGPSTDPEPQVFAGPDLKMGSKGPAVGSWQRVLEAKGYDLAPYGVDGDFGKLTHNATVGFQTERGLPPTGVVDAATWETIDTEPIFRPEPDGEITDTILSTNFTVANRTSVDNVVVHTIEGPEIGIMADNCAEWFASGPRAPRASAHYCLDDDSTILCVPEEHVSWTCPGLNRCGVHLEHAGYARQTTAQWFDPFSRRMLARSAKIAAAICKRWNIPVVYVDAAGLMRGERGITTHYQGTLGPGKGRTNHGDPGRWFPMSTYLDMIKEELQCLTA